MGESETQSIAINMVPRYLILDFCAMNQNQHLIQLLQESGVPAEIFESNVASEYLGYLTSCSLEEIKRQPAQLTKEKQNLDKQWLKITCDEYKSFLNAHEHLEEITTKMNKIPSYLDKLETLVPSLMEDHKSCQDFYLDSLETRKTINLITSQLEHLEPILEVPVLFDTLIRNNHYEEAMDLQLFTQRLPVRYPNIPLLEQLASINTSSQAMLNQLFSMLRGPAKLPICIRVMGYLRRLGLDDTTLRVLFLCLRFEFLSNLLGLVREPQKHEYVRRWIETQREHFLDIITHYKAIFPDATRVNAMDFQILGSFSLHAIAELLKVVDNFLDDIFDVSLLPSLNTQLMYYGLSLGRVGLDFRPLLVRRFELAVCRIIIGHFTEAQECFFVANSRIPRPNGSSSEQEMLLKYTPLAIAYNTYMAAFNQLRSLPCAAIYDELAKALKDSLAGIAKKVIDAHSNVKRDSEIIAWILSDVLIPRVVEGLNKVLAMDKLDYGSLIDDLRVMSDIAKSMGVDSRPSDAELTPLSPEANSGLAANDVEIEDVTTENKGVEMQ